MQKILIVEDDPIQLEMLYETVHSRYPAWEIKKGSSLEAAQAFLQESVTANEYFTLFLLDIQLSKEPGDRNGFQLAQSIREISVYYKTPILFLTSVSEELSRALTQFHCYNFITKPYQKETVLEQLRQMLLTGYLQDVLDIADTQRIHHRLQPQDIRYIESRSHTILYIQSMAASRQENTPFLPWQSSLEPPLSAATGVIWSIRSISQALTDLHVICWQTKTRSLSARAVLLY